MNCRDSFPASVSAACTRQRQRGYLMVVSLMIILLITVMSISMAKSFFQEEGMAGNIREKTRSFAAAQAALRYAEWAATQNGLAQGGTCATSGGNALATLSICNNQSTQPPSFGGPPLPAYWAMPASSLASTTATAATFTSTTTTDTYYALPGIYIWWEGANVNTAVYQITAFGYGGTSNSLSVVQASLKVNCPTQGRSSGGPLC